MERVIGQCIWAAKVVRDDCAHARNNFDNSHNTQDRLHIDASAKALGAVLLQKRAIEAIFYAVAYA